MNKYVKYVLIGIAVLGILAAVVYFLKKNSTPLKTYETETVVKRDITNKVVVTGKVIPQDEIEIKPQISGIIQKVYLEEGVQVKAGDLIATIKVVPNEQSLNQARGRVNNAKISLSNTKIEYDRNKTLFDKGVISSQDFNALQLRFDQATQELQNAQADYQIIRVGSAGGSSSANTNIRATVTGTLLEIPVEVGDQVIESNNFNDGTTIAFIADMSKMIFEGEVDEAEVGKLKVGMPLEISMGALQDEKFNAKLKFIAPKGVEEEGAVQFKIEGDMVVSDSTNIRAGYSANASIVLEEKKDVLSIKEALLQFDKETNKPYVEVETGENEFEKRELVLGVSDGIDVEIVSGIDENSKIKIWNKLEAKSEDNGPNED
ncbi:MULTISPECIES: efflux RND transporter periplasmic adaptor subunit [Maribacter]|jgi:HlyD family secretion protein|uniref:HlyD family secretion protein n=1 Tax=Maribacter stanieri TaxID=440514 RepID=A0A1I6IA91_9FLAO|nr:MULTISPECIES: efflux RND transporter periplasmic adaptor subunit [Maribacter]SFR63558.1 HlyD family secretion protein [Maribacter stanieri]|tara:strand:- start:84 stop:1208 length:1125 start_codon:yes stop_codon:yes gene_type:complete